MKAIHVSLAATLVISLFSVGASAESCNTSSAEKFQCIEACPEPAAGTQLLPLNCSCVKDTTAGTCTPRGKCSAYTLAGVPTGGREDCVCKKDPTQHHMAEPVTTQE